MTAIKNPPRWGIEPVPFQYRVLRERDYFILWSSLGVGLLVFSAGSFLSDASFIDAMLAIVIGSLVGSFLLALAGKIGSDCAIPSLVSMRPSFGIFVTLLGILGPLTVIKQWLGKFAIWLVYASSIIMIISLIMSENLPKLLSSPGSGMSFFPALDIVIAMPISWMPIAADYNRFAKNSNSALRATIIGFAITNILFYFGGILLGVTDVVLIIGAIQSIFFGFLILILIVSETDNTFADVYSAAVSTQNIYRKINQRYLIVGFTSVSTILAMMIPIAQYETFILLIGAVFVPLFGVVLSDYYIVRNRKYTEDMLFGKSALKIGFTAIISWSIGVVIYYLLSPLSPIHMAELPKIGATIPSIIVSSSLYLIMVRLKGHRERKVREPAS